MPLDADQIAWLRSEVGAEPDDAELDRRFARLGDLPKVAIEVLRTRRARLIASPLKLSVQGVATTDNTENLRALDRAVARLEADLGAEPTDSLHDVSVTRLGRRWTR